MKARGPWWGWVWLVRRVGKRLDRIADALYLQNVLLARLADQFAPISVPYEPEQPVSATYAPPPSVDFVNPDEAAHVLDYVQRTMQDLGRAPTDDEVLAYLADEATLALHTTRGTA